MGGIYWFLKIMIIKEVVFTNLIAGYVRTVAILLEIAPSKKAEKAERDSGEEDPFPAVFSFPSKSLCFS